MSGLGNIIAQRKIINEKIVNLREILRAAEDELKQLQKSCPHPDKQSYPEYDFIGYSCNFCGASWGERR